ncbi:MAG: flavodoxin family protein [Rhodopirellula sp.]|mgnify:FL=1|nr:flavodoxin family protein [Rhodopirellula sp.]
MSVRVLGISGSPIPGSNTDRAVQAVLKHTGLETQFIKLSDLEISPCRACLGCKQSNQCVVQDDGRSLAGFFRQVPAFVLGAYTPYSSLDARTKIFMERMYCFRHQIAGNAGKVGASVITTACPPGDPNLPAAAETARTQIRYWMMEEGMTDLGSLIVQGNVPCIRCGHGDDCSVSGIRMLYGPEATVASVGVKTFEDDGWLATAAKALGEKIRQAVGESRVESQASRANPTV